MIGSISKFTKMWSRDFNFLEKFRGNILAQDVSYLMNRRVKYFSLSYENAMWSFHVGFYEKPTLFSFSLVYENATSSFHVGFYEKLTSFILFIYENDTATFSRHFL